MKNTITRRAKPVALLVLLILLQSAGYSQALNNSLRLADLTSANSRLSFSRSAMSPLRSSIWPEREYSSDTPVRRVPFYADSYAVRALAVAYDLTARKTIGGDQNLVGQDDHESGEDDPQRGLLHELWPLSLCGRR